jgi:pimeloyl-ACP methyl ester carboxylesterase
MDRCFALAHPAGAHLLPTALQNSTALNSSLPLVVFSHGLGGSRLGYAHFGRHFAQNGFIALHLQHPGSDRAVWSGGPFTVLGNVQEAASEANVLGRAQDVSFALDMLLADKGLGPVIDREAIAVAGHSYGANTAMLLAGAAVERNGKRVSYADVRIKAAILLSAPPFHGEGDQAAVLRDVRVPTLHITGTDDVIRVPGYRSDATDRVGIFRDMPGAAPANKYLAIFEGGDHSVFTDRTRAERALAIKAAARDLSLAFLRSTLRQQPDALSDAFAAARPLLVTPEQVMARRFEAQINSTAN